jgi:hypothetical protein
MIRVVCVAFARAFLNAAVLLFVASAACVYIAVRLLNRSLRGEPLSLNAQAFALLQNIVALAMTIREKLQRVEAP